MNFQYRIAGRAHGVIEQTLYEGQVQADTPKEAILKALAAEFGDDPPGQADPLTALTGTGWMDRADFLLQYNDLTDDDSCFELEAKNTFIVEVGEVEGEEVGDEVAKVPYSNAMNPTEQVDAEEEVAGLLFQALGPQLLEGVRPHEEVCNDLGREVVYRVLRRFRPDLFTDDPDRGKHTLQICTNDDRYFLVSTDVLRRSLDVPRQDRLGWLYGRDRGHEEAERITATRIYSDDDVDVTLVPDDSEGWDDYEEQVKDLIADSLPAPK